MLLKHKETGRLKSIKVNVENYLSNGWEPAEGPAKKETKKSKKADPIVESTPNEVYETKPITESKENEDGNN